MKIGSFAIKLLRGPPMSTLVYTWENNGRQLVKVFEEILRRKAGSSGPDGRRNIVSRNMADRSQPLHPAKA